MAAEFMFWAPLAPVLLLLTLRRHAPPVYWIVALAFLVSWFADAFARWADGSWAAVSYYPVAQMGLFAWAFGGHVWALAVALIAAPLTWFEPPVWPRVIGSIAALLLAKGHTLSPVVVLYCGVGTILYLGMIRHATPEAYEPFMRWWFPYQAARLAAFGLFVHTAWKEG
jgi:hypothetical protein